MKLKTVFIRLALVWLFAGQMIFVCLPARTTRSLGQLESLYAFKPSPANKSALDNEFERTAVYETQRATWKFDVMLAADVLVIALGWNWGLNRKRTREAVGSVEHPLDGELSAS